jgi:hypothetical protein
MVTRVIPAEPVRHSDPSARTVVLRPDEALRHLASDLDKVSNVVVQTEALGWKMVELSQSLAHIEPTVVEATTSLMESNQRMSDTADRVLAAVEIMEMAQRHSMESLNKRMGTLTGLVYWALSLGSCAMAGIIIAAFAYFSRAH